MEIEKGPTLSSLIRCGTSSKTFSFQLRKPRSISCPIIMSLLSLSLSHSLTHSHRQTITILLLTQFQFPLHVSACYAHLCNSHPRPCTLPWSLNLCLNQRHRHQQQKQLRRRRRHQRRSNRVDCNNTPGNGPWKIPLSYFLTKTFIISTEAVICRYLPTYLPTLW